MTVNGHYPSGMPVGEEDLVSLVQGGDALAFTVLYDRHVRAAYSLAYAIVGQRQDAEDLVQDAFLRVWLAAGTYRAERGNVKTWVLSIVQNRGIDELRAAASRRAREGGEANTPRLQPCEAFGEAWGNSQRERVRQALMELPPEQLKILELAYFSDHTHVEIAELLGLPLGTVKGRVRLARES